MNIQTIDPKDFSVRIHTLWDKGWFLLSAGNYAEGKFNSMTISWGWMGNIWNKPVVQVLVRPTRYTFEFMESNPDFTVCAFPDEYRKALNLLGAKSGRDGDKIKESGLTPCRSSQVTAPSYIESNLVIECRKIYTDVIKPQNFIEKSIDKHYNLGDYHKIYYGEIVTLRGDPSLYSN
ncbi:MAG: flavin reductase [Anaerolinea sp.]|nr:flavin reductase [Anaerolinea sp.]